MTKQYIASIKNNTRGTWVKSIAINSYTETLFKKERHIFKDKKRAEKILKILQERYPDTFTLYSCRQNGEIIR
ncbi:hypothetical protein JUJ52_02995 [Virgibacillus sp. AGTR]|uniref:hypothetical protein n=1 Tax=Virgibacillus sp. AGTR TaxID=2812055 RepID=UPI001D16BB4B|nr:hypothetical protein [Virgibacillus sp. AGTR]MCC2248924.1 hypothetical protein [Virgibacillus sp. AGTR]